MIRCNDNRVLPFLAICCMGALPAFSVALPRGEPSAKDDKSKAREIVTLMELGQIGLTDAIQLAEKHTGGKAVSATCQIVVGAPEKPGDAKPDKGEMPSGGPTVAAQIAEKRLSYQIVTVAGDKITSATVDGVSRKVSAVRELKSLRDDS